MNSEKERRGERMKKKEGREGRKERRKEHTSGGGKESK